MTCLPAFSRVVQTEKKPNKILFLLVERNESESCQQVFIVFEICAIEIDFNRNFQFLKLFHVQAFVI